MKKVLRYLLVLLFILQTNLFPQSPIVQQIINSVNIDSLIYFVRELSGDVPTIINGTSQTILSRHKYQPGNALAETYIKQKLQSYGLTTTLQSFSTTGKNVLATQIGTVYPNKKYIICAHYDDMPEGTIAPGATDNAGGTSAVIEAARILSQYTFPFTIIYALWDEEEQWLVGSTYYATQAAAAGDSILGVINLDGGSYDPNNDGRVNVHNCSVGSSILLYNNIVEVNNLYGINLNVVSRNPPRYDSDQASFWAAGYGAIFPEEDYDDEPSPYIHTINDSVQYLSQSYYLKTTKLSLGTLAVLASYLNFDIVHAPIVAAITPQEINSNAFIFTGVQIGTGSLTPRMYYRTKEYGGSFGNFIELAGNSTGGGNYTFNIPALPNETLVQYYIAAQDANSTIVRTLPLGGSGFNPPGSTPPATFFQFFVVDLNVIMSDDADNITNWTSTGGWNTTTEKYVSTPSSFTDSPGGNYPPNSTAIFSYNDQIQFLGAFKTFLEFDAQWAMEDNYDYGQVQISTNNGTSWTPLAGQYTDLGIAPGQPNGEPLYDGYQNPWVHEIIDITNYSNRQIDLRFLLKSDGDINYDGWYIDNVKVSIYATILAEQPYVGKTYARKDVDSVLFRIKFTNLYNHQFTPNLIYANSDSTEIDSLTLLDDGVHGDSLANDGIYGGYIPPRTIEDYYSLSLSIFDPQLNKYNNTSDICRFTTVPLLIDSVQCNAISNYRYSIKPFLKNAGTVQTIKNIIVKLTSDDPWVTSITPTQRVCPNLLPGQTAGVSAAFAVSYDTTTFPDSFNLKFEIMSGGYSYWKFDTTIYVDPNDVDEESNDIPTEFLLSQNYPNPLNPSTTIKYSIPKSSQVTLKIFNTLGEEITTLVNEEKSVGTYEVNWNAVNLPSGVYFYQLKAGEFTSVKKMILLR